MKTTTDEMSAVYFKRVCSGYYTGHRKSDGARVTEISKTEQGEWLIEFWEAGEKLEPYDADIWPTYGYCRERTAQWVEQLKGPLYRG